MGEIREFLENTYGHKFKKIGGDNSYGVAFFYANNIEDNPEAAMELLTSWFYNVLIKNYNKEVKKYNRIFPLIKDEFMYKQIWSPILKAVMHFDNNITHESAVKHILELSKKENMNIKIIDDYQIIYK